MRDAAAAGLERLERRCGAQAERAALDDPDLDEVAYVEAASIYLAEALAEVEQRKAEIADAARRRGWRVDLGDLDE